MRSVSRCLGIAMGLAALLLAGGAVGPTALPGDRHHHPQRRHPGRPGPGRLRHDHAGRRRRRGRCSRPSSTTSSASPRHARTSTRASHGPTGRDGACRRAPPPRRTRATRRSQPSQGQLDRGSGCATQPPARAVPVAAEVRPREALLLPAAAAARRPRRLGAGPQFLFMKFTSDKDKAHGGVTGGILHFLTEYGL